MSKLPSSARSCIQPGENRMKALFTARLSPRALASHIPASKLCRIAIALSVPLACSTLCAQESADELAKKLSNPVAALISVPLQLNGDFNYGTEDGTRVNLNIQPVIPSSISENWNVITRVIVPITSQNDIAGNSGHQFGLGDTTPSFFFSPKAPTAGGVVWGVGPAFLLPTATDDLLGTGKWGVGPTAVILKQTAGGWTYGALINQIWSVGGQSDRADVSRGTTKNYEDRERQLTPIPSQNSSTASASAGAARNWPACAPADRNGRRGNRRSRRGRAESDRTPFRPVFRRPRLWVPLRLWRPEPLLHPYVRWARES